jgi:4-hydroxy-tetrahydrodipicolinate synthase
MRFTPRGIIPAMITPVDDAGRLNLPEVRAHARRLANAGVHGLFVNGSQGEFYAFTADEKTAVIEAVLDEVGDRVRVYAGTGAITTREAVALTVAAERAGAHAVSVITPLFITPSDDELYEHFAAVARATTLPVILYNNPGRTNVHIRPEVVRRLAAIENIVGVKDTSGDLVTTIALIQAAPPGVAVLAGHDALILATLVHGGAGAVSSTANVVPRLVVDLYGRFMAGDLEQARVLQARLAPLRQAFGLGTFPVVIKEALRLLGYPVGMPRAPVGPLSEVNRARLREVLAGLGLHPLPATAKAAPTPAGE